MALINFQDWRAKMRESSAFTRQRDGWARYGNYPPNAGVMGHSTPAPFIVKKAEEEFGKPKKKHKKKKK